MEMRQKALKGLMDFLLAMPDEMPEGGSVTVIEAEEMDDREGKDTDVDLRALKKKKKELLEG